MFVKWSVDKLFTTPDDTVDYLPVGTAEDREHIFYAIDGLIKAAKIKAL